MLSHTSRSSWNWTNTALSAICCIALVVLFNGEYLFSDKVGILDWPKELFYFHVLRTSITEYGQLPLSLFTIPDSLAHFSTLQNLSYWANPEVVSMSPFLPLALVLDTVPFIKAYFMGHFLIGIAGTLLLAKRLGFDPFLAIILFALLFLNPWLTQHLAIGYSPAINCLLLPLLAVLLMARNNIPAQLGLAALVNATVFLQGALHMFVWFNLAAVACALLCGLHERSPKPFFRALWVQVLTFPLIFAKYHAVSDAYADFVRYPGHGYASLEALLGLLTDATSPLFDFPATYSRYGVAFYDGSLLVGWWFLFLTGLAFIGWLRPRQSDSSPGFPGWVPFVCAAFFLFLGWGAVWNKIAQLVPVLSSEIYPFRFLWVAFLFTAVFTLEGLRRLSCFVPKGILRTVALAALFLPTMFLFYERNDLLASLNSSEEDIFGGFSFKEYLTHRVVGYSGNTLLPCVAIPAGLTLIPPGTAGDPVQLPWLEPWRIREFTYQNLQPDMFQPETSTVFLTEQPVRPAVILAKDYSRANLSFIGVCSYGLFVTASLIFAARRRRETTKLW
jgi:hypothetical protein